jgi:hypothetical protein
VASDKASAAARLWFPLFYVLMFSSLYVWAFHEPTPHHVPVAVVSSTPEAGRLAAGVNSRSGSAFDVRQLPDDARARAAVHDWRVRGAYDPAGQRLYVATMAAPSGTMATEKLFRSVAAAQHGSLRTSDLAPPPAGDPRGISVFYTLIAWTIGGFLCGIMLNMTPERPGPGSKLGLIAGFAVVGSTLSNVLAGPVIGALPSAPLATSAMIGVGSLQITTVAILGIATRNFASMLVTNGLIAAIAIFLDFPSAGDAVSRYLLPGPFRVLNQIVPGAAVSRASRAILYFGGTNWLPQLPVLLAWPAGGLLLLAAGTWWHRRRARAERGSLGARRATVASTRTRPRRGPDRDVQR